MILFLLIIIQVCNISCRKTDSLSHDNKRIVSLAPAITETLFALGLGKKIVGVTRYCVFPPETKEIEKIGGYSDANLEKIVGLKPDIVVLSKEHIKQKEYLSGFGIYTLTVDMTTKATICTAFALIGRYCNANRSADSLLQLFEKTFANVNKDLNRKKILICVGRDAPGAGTIKSVYAAGQTTFYNDIIKAAGAINAFPDSFPIYPSLSTEGILTVAPDIIIDVAPAMGYYSCSLLVNDWKQMSRLPAVKNNRIYCLPRDYATVPGPRIILLLNDIRAIVSGEWVP